MLQQLSRGLVILEHAQHDQKDHGNWARDIVTNPKERKKLRRAKRRLEKKDSLSDAELKRLREIRSKLGIKSKNWPDYFAKKKWDVPKPGNLAGKWESKYATTYLPKPYKDEVVTAFNDSHDVMTVLTRRGIVAGRILYNREAIGEEAGDPALLAYRENDESRFFTTDYDGKALYWLVKEEKAKESVLEHASHNQKDHGNWARGIRNKPSNEAEKGLINFLDTVSEVKGEAPKGFKYNGMEDLLRKNGEFFEPPEEGEELPFGCKKGNDRECFYNAFKQMNYSDQLIYTEGYATSDILPGYAFPHAWLTTPDGKVIDVTWPPGHGTSYFGVRLKTKYVIDALSETMTAGVIVNDWMRDSPLMKEGFPEDALWKPEEDVKEHDTGHDEKDHGNWARGISHEPGEIQKKKKKSPLSSDPMKPSGSKPQPGINRRAFIAEMENGKKAYVKNILRGSKASLHEAIAEVTAYELDRELGFELVPETVIRNDLQGHPGFEQYYSQTLGTMVQSQFKTDLTGEVVASEWIEDATLLEDIFQLPDDEREALATPELKQDFERMMALDVLINNEDRHDRQILIHWDGERDRLAAIDHGWSFNNGYFNFSGAEIEAEDWMANSIQNSMDAWRGIDRTGTFDFDVSENGPWRRIVDNRDTIERMVEESFARRGASPEHIDDVIEGLSERIDIIGYWLDEGDLEYWNESIQADKEKVQRLLEGLRLQEHASHDQKDHGNWARGISHEPGELDWKKELDAIWKGIEKEEKAKSFDPKELKAKASAAMQKARDKEAAEKAAKKRDKSPTGREYSDIEKRLQSDPMKPSGVKAQTGVNVNAYIAEMENGEKAFVKTIQDSLRMDYGDEGGNDTEALAEVTAYELDQALGYEIVPPIVVGKDGITVVSEWVDDAVMLAEPSHPDIDWDTVNFDNNPELKRDFENMMALDVIIGNTDRHSGQILIYRKNGKLRLAAIDHGLSLFSDHLDGWGDRMNAHDWVNEYIDDTVYQHGDQIFDRWGPFPFDLSDDGPWQQMVRDRDRIESTVRASMSSHPDWYVDKVVTAMNARIGVIEYMLENQKFKTHRY